MVVMAHLLQSGDGCTLIVADGAAPGDKRRWIETYCNLSFIPVDWIFAYLLALQLHYLANGSEKYSTHARVVAQRSRIFFTT